MAALLVLHERRLDHCPKSVGYTLEILGHRPKELLSSSRYPFCWLQPDWLLFSNA